MLGLYLRSARYYKPSQIATRFRLGMSSFLIRELPWLARRRYAVPAGLAKDERAWFFDTGVVECSHELAPSKENAQCMERGVFRLLNKELTLGFPVDWDPSGTTRLWRYNLHYFDYALDLATQVKWQKDERAADLWSVCFASGLEPIHSAKVLAGTLIPSRAG